MNPQDVMQERYPDGYFSKYWSAVEKCRRTHKDYMQNHHLCPRKQFPEYENGFPENIIAVSPEEHIWLHRVLEACGGPKSPPIAWLEAQREACAKGGKAGGAKGAATNKRNGTGFFDPETGRKGGRIQGRKNAENHTGFCGRSKEQMTIDGRKAGLKNVENRTGFFAPGMQAKAGRIGGRASQATLKAKGLGLYDPETVAKGVRIANHTRWHVNRGIINPNCKLCSGSITPTPATSAD